MTRTTPKTLALFCAAALALNATSALAVQPEQVVVSLIGNSGAEIGTATIIGGQTGVVMRVEIAAGGLTPGWHGLHFHAVGDCSDKEEFKNAKAHVNHTGAEHGLLNPNGHEQGDLPNLWVAEDGSARAEIASQMVTLSMGPHALIDADGSTLIIHAAEDDHQSQPIGNAGARVSCGLIK